MSAVVDQKKFGAPYIQEKPPVGIEDGTLWYSLTNNVMYIYKSGTWQNFQYRVGTNGYFYHGTLNTSTVTRMEFPFDSSIIETVGTINDNVPSISTGFNSQINGYLSANGFIEKFEFPFLNGTSVNIGVLPLQVTNTRGINSSSHGYICSGLNNSIAQSAVQRMAFSYNGISVNTTYLDKVKQGAGGVNSSIHGYIGGGGTTTSDISRMLFPFDSGTTTRVGTLITNRTDVSACNSTEHGYFFGGYTTVNTSIIQRISFPLDSGTATSVGSLGLITSSTSCVNASIYGYCSGGINHISTIERIAFPFSSGLAITLGTLTSSRTSAASCDETDFITQFN